MGLPPLGPYFRELWRRREFALELARTNMRAQHLNTTFGRIWLILNPLLLATTYFVLIDILRHGQTQQPHRLERIVAGIFAYYFFSGAVREGARTVTSSGRLVLNTAFPRMLLPLASVTEHFLRFVPTMAVYFVIHVATGLAVGPHLLLIVPLTLALAGTSAGMSLIVATAQVYFRDLKQFLPYILRIWLYLSPVLWTVDMLNKLPSGYHAILWVNPIGALLAAWSDVLIKGVVPGSHLFIAAGAWALGLLVVGTLFFMSREREFAVRL